MTHNEIAIELTFIIWYWKVIQNSMKYIAKREKKVPKNILDVFSSSYSAVAVSVELQVTRQIHRNYA